MDKEEFKKRWESDGNGGGINYNDIADCAIDWGISPHPRIEHIHVILYKVLSAANVADADGCKTE